MQELHPLYKSLIMNIPDENFVVHSNLKKILFKKIPIVWYMNSRENIKYFLWKEHPFCKATNIHLYILGILITCKFIKNIIIAMAIT